jgi:N6-L-threonylcarbamoyladenine synthase
VDVITAKTILAAETCGEKVIAMAGGVAANSRLRETLRAACERRGFTLYAPSPALCTDNGAMIGAAAYYQYREKGGDDLLLDAYPNLDM